MKQPSRAGQLLTKQYREKKLAEIQAALPKVRSPPGEPEINNDWSVLVLGAMIQADGGHMKDVERRIGLGYERFGKMRNIWNSKELPLKLKLRLYEAFVISVVTHAHESWILNKATLKKLRGFNAACLSKLTNRSRKAEASSPTIDLCRILKKRRLRYFGHLLRLEPHRWARRAALSFVNTNNGDCLTYMEGSLAEDGPQADDIDDLVAKAGEHGDHAVWDEHVANEYPADSLRPADLWS